MPGHTFEHPNGSGSIFKLHGNDSILNRETPNGLKLMDQNVRNSVEPGEKICILTSIMGGR